MKTSTVRPAAEAARPKPDVEGCLVAILLAAVAALPALNILSREFSIPGFADSQSLVQHLVLLIGIAGGALAVRDGRLVSLAATNRTLHGRALSAARILAGGTSSAISLALAAAASMLARAGYGLGRTFVYGIPDWIFQATMAAGFIVIALRLVWNGSGSWRGRVLAALIPTAVGVSVLCLPVDPESFRWPLFAVLGVATICGMPIFAVLGGTALILIWTGGDTIAAIALQHYELTVNPTLPSLPLFTLAGCFFAAGGAAGRLVRFFNAAVGGIRGGPAIIAALACAFFTSFTGASGVTILALGGVLMPVLATSGYPGKPSLGLLTGAGSLGVLFPPCLPPILYAIIASNGGQTSITLEEMFQGGLIPGLLLVGMAAWWGMRQGRQEPAVTRFSWSALRSAAWQAKWELLAPVVALVALFSGWATAVEAASLTAIYSLVVTVFVWRDLKDVRAVIGVGAECGILIGGVLLILGVALGLTDFIIFEQIPDHIVGWVTGHVHSPYLFLFFLNGMLLIVGAFIDIYSAIIVVAPLIVPLGNEFGIDPIHLGVVFLANLELGFLTPPVGLNLLVSASRFNRPLGEVVRATLPILGVMAVGVLLITYFPPLSTWLPGILR